MVRVTGTLQVEIDDNELAKALYQKIMEIVGKDFDDDGHSLLTDDQGQMFCSNRHWLVSKNPNVAALVDSMNFLKHGFALKVNPPAPKGDDIKTLKHLHERAFDVGIDRYIIPDEMDIMWVRLGSDGKESWQYMVNTVLQPKGSMRVYGLCSNADVQKIGNVYQIRVADSRNQRLICTSNELQDLEDVRDFLLIYYKGIEGIHDFGEVPND